MEYLRKGAQAASKLGNKILEAVEDGQNNFGNTGSPGGGSGSAGDVEHDPAVRRARVLTASLKSVGGRAQAWIASLKGAGAGASATAQVALEASKDEFGEDSQFTVATQCLCNVLLEADAKFTAQLCSLLQRDIIEPIQHELEQNSHVKAALDEHSQGVPAGSERLLNLLSRRRIVLAQALTSLVGHQANYHARIGAQYAPLNPHVQANKALLERERASNGSNSVSKQSAPASASQRESTAAAPLGAGRAAPAAAPPVKPTRPPPPPAEDDLLGLNSPKAKSPPQQSAEGDLLGMSGGGGGGGGGASSAEGDLLGEFLSPTSHAGNNGGPKGATEGGNHGGAPQHNGDLLDFAGPSTSVGRAGASSGGGDLLDFAGPGPVAKHDSVMDMFDPLSTNGVMPATAGGAVSGGGGGGQKQSRGGESTGTGRPAAKAGPPAASSFTGQGTDREALKQQFDAHVQRKAEEAADLVRKSQAEKEEYDEMKWKSADAVDKRIIAWAGPKHSRKNLRAMLSTFESVIHDEAKAKWKPVGLHELVMADQVKKIHRKAILLVHPDKVQNASMESKLIAEHVHAVLHEALEAFRKQEGC